MIAVIIPMIAVITRGAMEAATRLDLAVRKTGVALERAVARGSILLSHETRLQLRGKGEDDPFLGRKGAPAPFLGSRSGFAAGRITPGGRVFRSGNMVFSVVGSPDRYVKFHEEGGTISGNQFLRIPLKLAQTPGGSELGEFKGKRLRGREDFLVVKSKAGRLFLGKYKRKGNGPRRASRGTPHVWPGLKLFFLLARSVRIPGRHPFRAVRDRVAPQINAMTAGEVELVMRRANGV